MARNRYSEILLFIRFDDRAQRSRRVDQDKFYLIREEWDTFVSNCISEYHPSPFLTADEQLVPTKARCPFTQYMPHKPVKFGIKLCMLADAERPYIMNVHPYLDKNFDDERCGVQLGEHDVLKLMEPFIEKGYNVTTDTTFFFSLRLLPSSWVGSRPHLLVPCEATLKKRHHYSLPRSDSCILCCRAIMSRPVVLSSPAKERRLKL